MAPEMLQRRYYLGEKIDVFSLGVVQFNLVVGLLPFGKGEAKTDNLLYRKLVSKDQDGFWKEFEEENKSKFSDGFKALFVVLVEVDPNRRMNLDRVRDSEWQKEGMAAKEEVIKFCKGIKEEMKRQKQTNRESQSAFGEHQAALEPAVAM